jgi:hypothetical protein
MIFHMPRGFRSALVESESGTAYSGMTMSESGTINPKGLEVGVSISMSISVTWRWYSRAGSWSGPKIDPLRVL